MGSLILIHVNQHVVCLRVRSQPQDCRLYVMLTDQCLHSAHSPKTFTHNACAPLSHALPQLLRDMQPPLCTRSTAQCPQLPGRGYTFVETHNSRAALCVLSDRNTNLRCCISCSPHQYFVAVTMQTMGSPLHGISTVELKDDEPLVGEPSTLNPQP